MTGFGIVTGRLGGCLGISGTPMRRAFCSGVSAILVGLKPVRADKLLANFAASTNSLSARSLFDVRVQQHGIRLQFGQHISV